jgi:penicillin-binding protein 2
MGGTFYRPHVVDPEQLPGQFKNVVATSSMPDVVHVPIDPQNWITITDAMAGVLNPGGTGVASHIQGVDFAGKTGSTQLVSHQFLEAHGQKIKSLSKEFKGNGWFAGVTPRRNPEIVVAVLFEGGEHGPLAARVASQVIKAYVEKQRRLRNNPMLFSDKADPGSVPIAGVWNQPDSIGQLHKDAASAHAESGDEVAENDSELHGGTVLVKLGKTRMRRSARSVSIGLAGSD